MCCTVNGKWAPWTVLDPWKHSSHHRLFDVHPHASHWGNRFASRHWVGTFCWFSGVARGNKIPIGLIIKERSALCSCGPSWWRGCVVPVEPPLELDNRFVWKAEAWKTNWGWRIIFKRKKSDGAADLTVRAAKIQRRKTNPGKDASGKHQGRSRACFLQVGCTEDGQMLPDWRWTGRLSAGLVI